MDMTNGDMGNVGQNKGKLDFLSPSKTYLYEIIIPTLV